MKIHILRSAIAVFALTLGFTVSSSQAQTEAGAGENPSDVAGVGASSAGASSAGTAEAEGELGAAATDGVAEVAEAVVAPIQIPSRDDVLNQCASVSVQECTELVTAYMEEVVALGLPPEEINQVVANFVVELTAVSQSNPAFEQADINVVDAIRTVATYIKNDDAQAQRLATIADTIEEDNDFQTADLGDPASPSA